MAAGCVAIPHNPLSPKFVSGTDAARRVDIEFGGTIAAHDPGVAIGRASCPLLVDVSGNRPGRCTLPVAGGVMRVDVGASSSPAAIRSPDAVVVRSVTESAIIAMLAARARFVVRCPGPPAQVVANGTRISCALSRGGKSAGVARIVYYSSFDGPYLISPKLPYHPRANPLYGLAVTSQTATRVTADGARMARYLASIAGANQHDALVRRGLIRGAQCPPKIVLTPETSLTCSVNLGGSFLEYDLRFDTGRGAVVDTESVVLIVADITASLRRYFLHALPLVDPRAPAGTRIRIDCGPDAVALLAPGESLPCTAYAGSDAFAVSAQLLNGSGDVAFTIPRIR